MAIKETERRLFRFSAALPFLLCALLLFATGATGQQAEPQASQPAAVTSSQNVEQAWSDLLQGTIPQTQVDPTLAVPQSPPEKRAAGDFLDHFFFEDHSEYWRTQTAFTRFPTATGVINAVPGLVTNPNGIPDPSVFQPSNNEFHNFMDLGTRGWLSDRVNTDFSLR
jgi:hypothetical protein